MKQRGRVGRAALEVIPNVVHMLDRVERQRPPPDLTPEQARFWLEVVNEEPADWFSKATRPLLAQYCRHKDAAEVIGKMIEAVVANPDLELRDYDVLLKMQARESGELASLATKMRLAQQSTSNHRGNKKQISTFKPWNQEQDDKG